ncbi:MAG: catalase [Deltaproteobacteria bacterium]|nr:catalase [Deltaproteobacteria bacterium]
MATRKQSRNGGNRRQLPAGGETHQQASTAEQAITTNLGVPIADDQNSLRIGARGPTLLEDFVLREKITHFDHERIPERIVHARGSAAHGYFQASQSLSRLTRAAFLQDPKIKTPVFVRFSTVAGGAGSVDLPRDVRGFAVKFYTSEGNFDLVGNNIPVFFIQDAMKFPDLVHAVKMEPDRGFPQNASAHDTFWDFVSLMPESMHMLMWVMSDRAIPRSLRMIEGFGVNTFRFVDAGGRSTFVKFHWRPVLGAASVLWDEAVKINGADQDFHRRDLWTAIDRGDYPEFELAIQAVDEEAAERLPFDILDATKLVPEEMVPLEVIGRLVLDRNPDNFFAETEQVAFCPANLVPGIEFSNDPLLQGRLFSYLDTQLLRLGGPNFHELEINRPRCPMRNFQRDGHMRMQVPSGRVAYEPSSLDPDGPREHPQRGFASPALAESGEKRRLRAESFADHYSQARQFWRSMSEPEQRHIVGAFAFELGKVETVAIRRRMLGHLAVIEDELAGRVAAKLGMQGEAERIEAARPPIELEPSPALSLVRKAKPTLAGRTIGVLVAAGSDRGLIDRLRSAVEKEGGRVEVVGTHVGGVSAADGKPIAVDHALAAGPSILFDAVVVAVAGAAAAALTAHPNAVDWLRDAFAHLKVIGYVAGSMPLLERAGIDADAGVLPLDGAKDVGTYLAAAKRQRVWAREAAIEARAEIPPSGAGRRRG